MIKKIARNLIRRASAVLGEEFYLKKQLLCNRERHGGVYGGWEICPDYIDSSSIVYSVGIGQDISFDTSLIEKYGLTIHAFDPTPKSIQWVSNQKLPKNFKMYDIGLADYDGQAEFVLPLNPDHVSCSILSTMSAGNEKVQVQVKTLAAIMDMLGHSSIDLLKIDIEGAEYQVIDDVIKSKIIIKQFLVEFHYRNLENGIAMTNCAIKKLNDNGYLAFAISDNFEEISFIYTSQP